QRPRFASAAKIARRRSWFRRAPKPLFLREKRLRRHDGDGHRLDQRAPRWPGYAISKGTYMRSARAQGAMIRPGAPLAPAWVWHELQSPAVRLPAIARVFVPSLTTT